MYTPSSFRVTDPSLTNAFIREQSFGLLLTTEGGRIHDTHTPFLLTDDERYLCGHIAKANPQWKSWDLHTTATVIFTGPHSYISPSYYASDFNVPTWNYTAVTVRGPLSILSEEELVVNFIDSLVSHYEDEKSAPWSLNHSDERYMQLLSSIVAFQVEVAEVETSFKLNQNKSLEDQKSVMHQLRQSSSPMDRQVASLMEKNI
ncbi:FMN-binding negative transcriptional regulator [Bythopirellula goksoeyrii]|uniref:Protease synthase and sporulation protein PAI 2 n=1 Tax=Bythopirellula goksoeyrii TaxID=1400387 RepID=A0A5B9QT83_9BACT|nr:FMN-binding negative transcriptional regulator [Bythopirellula goksoeyrii]QEG37133.1 Protease synthase and sporulation protein PAI 2 [Bythopirellula goksoeyrii]